MVASDNVAVGYQALFSNVGLSSGDGWYNTAVGVNALYTNNSTSWGYGWAASNTALGYEALYLNNSGYYNTASGQWALYSNTTGYWNTATGLAALDSNTTGYQNTANGVGALTDNTAGYLNTASGVDALYYNTTGSYNTAIGYQAGPDYNNHGNLTYATAIGAGAIVNQSNALALGGPIGNGNDVHVGIGTSTPAYRLTLAQGSGGAMADAWSTWSSRRWKTNIHTLRGALGKVGQLRGVSYDLKANGKHEIGVIAEEVGSVIPEVVSYEKNGEDASGVDYGRLTALLIEATKEQQALIHEQQLQIKAQQKQMNQQAAQISRLSLQVEAIRTAIIRSDRTAAQVQRVKAQMARQ